MEMIQANALCVVETKFRNVKVVKTRIEMPAEYTADWQCDAHCWHDEGSWEYDEDEAVACYPDEFEEITLTGTWKENKRDVITKILHVVDFLFVH